MNDEYISVIERFFADNPVDFYRFERRSRHRAVVGARNGKPFCVIFPATGSDRRGPANTVTALRHATGLVGAPANDNEHPHPAKRAKRRKPASRGPQLLPSRVIESPVVRVDRFYAPLMAIKARLVAVANQQSIVAVGASSNEKPEMQSSAATPGETRVRLMTPWLGKQKRYCTI